MSIIIQFNSSSFIPSAPVVPSANQCRSKVSGKAGITPGNDHSIVSVMNNDENTIHKTTSNNVFATSLKEVKSFCCGLPYQDHNYGAAPPESPPSYSPCPPPTPPVTVPDEDTSFSCVSVSTEEAKEESITRCICGFDHDDEYMICCDNCLVWQHVDCMELDRKNMPDTYLCEKCEPRKLDRHKAKLLQARKRLAMTVVKPPITASPIKQDPKLQNASTHVLLKYSRKKAPEGHMWTSNQNAEYASLHPNPMPDTYCGTSESDEGSNKNNDRRPKTRNKRRKKGYANIDQSVKKKKPYSKHLKVKFGIKRSKMKRIKNKDSTSTADEEAQDAWEYNSTWREENFENAMNNQYTPEVQHLARLISSQGYEKRFLDQLRSRQCEVQSSGSVNQLICICDLPRNQPIIECKGKYLLASQFHEIHPLYNKRLYPFVLFYNLGKDEICVDASFYGNDARFVRRSCKPNSEIRFMSYNGNLHLYLASTKVVFKDDEVTIPFPLNESNSFKEIECACDTANCAYKPKKLNGDIEACQEKKRRSRRTTLSADDDDSTNSLTGISIPIEKSRNQVEKPKTSERLKSISERAKVHNDKTKNLNDKPKVHAEKTKILTDRLRGSSERVKMLAEKIKAENEKTKVQIEKPKALPERGRIASERLKNANAEKLKTPEKVKTPEKIKISPIKVEIFDQVMPDPSTSNGFTENKILSDCENEDQMLDNKKKLTREERKLDAIMRAFDQLEKAEKRRQQAMEKHKSLHPPKSEEYIERQENILDIVKDEEKPDIDMTVVEPKKEVEEEEDEKPLPPKPKKGKRRRGSGTPSRRRTRTNSGGSDVLPPEEIQLLIPKQDLISSVDSVPVAGGIPVSDVPVSGTVPSPVSMSTPASPVVLKTKRFLLHEWLQEKSESMTATPSPLTLHTEVQWNTSTASATCYVRCTKDSPLSSGISAAHLRSNGISGQPRPAGSAKKRWLRQAMYDCSDDQVPMDQGSIDNLDNGCLSPNSHGDTDSPGPTADDLLTPLKKRRLMRESVESISSPHSTDDTDTTVSNSFISSAGTEQGADTFDQELLCNGTTNAIKDIVDCNVSPPENEEDSLKAEAYEPPNELKESDFEQYDGHEHEQPVGVNTPEKTDSFESMYITSLTSEMDSTKVELPTEIESLNATNECSLTVNLNNSITNIDTDIDYSNLHMITEVCESLGNKLQNIIQEDKSSDTKSVCKEIVDTNHEQHSPKTDAYPSVNNSNQTSVSFSNILSVKEDGVVEESSNQLPTVESLEMSPPGSPMQCATETNNAMYVNSDTSVHNEEMAAKAPSTSSIGAENVSSCNDVVTSSDVDSSQTLEAEFDEKVTKADLEEQSSSEESMPTKRCASATQKRKVSLSEYRLRMRENPARPVNIEPAKRNSLTPPTTATMIPDTSLEQVTLAPLPLFDTHLGSRISPLKHQACQTIALKKKTSPQNQESNNHTHTTLEHRENLNERLKREFGFDISDGPPKASSVNQIKTKSNNQIPSIVTKFYQLPPPPPPPRQPRPPSVAQPQFSYTPRPYPHSQPQFIVPQAPPIPSYMNVPPPPIPAPMIPPSPVHQIDPRSAAVGVRPPLLPSSHQFTPPVHGALLPTPDPQKYAQRYITPMVQNTYPHVYPSGLYK